MILVTGGTGFIGQVLIQHLVEAGHRVRTLVRPSSQSPNLPKGIPVEVAVTSLKDERGLRAAMMGVHTVYHLASSERRGAYGNMMETDAQGTRAVAETAIDSGIQHLFFISHLGADRASAYPILQIKGIAEEHIRNSGVNFTILRSAVAFGPGDRYTTRLAWLARSLPFIFPLPGDGNTIVQPIWVEDLVACLIWALDDEGARNRIYEVGGGEYLTITQIMETILSTMRMRRRFVHLPPPSLRTITMFLESSWRGFPLSIYWLDYLATNRTCSLDTLPRVFNLIPARFSQHIEYLKTPDWLRTFRYMLRRERQEKRRRQKS
jgi:NADH dehydrogenase